MTNLKTYMGLLVLLAMMLGMGCTPAYHSYSGCHVDCQYRAPAPLPYTHYDDYVCHSCAASRHSALPQEVPEQAREAVESGDDRSSE